MQHSLKRMWALLGAVAVISATVAASATAAHKAGPNIVIWTDQDRAAAVTKVANAWAATNGATIQVVTKNFGDIRDNRSEEHTSELQSRRDLVCRLLLEK